MAAIPWEGQRGEHEQCSTFGGAPPQETVYQMGRKRVPALPQEPTQQVTRQACIARVPVASSLTVPNSRYGRSRLASKRLLLGGRRSVQ